MSRVALVIIHDQLAPQVIWFGDDASNEKMLDHVVSTVVHHKIKEIIICTEDMKFTNVLPISSWIKTTRRLTK